MKKINKSIFKKKDLTRNLVPADIIKYGYPHSKSKVFHYTNFYTKLNIV